MKVILAYRPDQKWDKVQLPQKAHLCPQRLLWCYMVEILPQLEDKPLILLHHDFEINLINTKLSSIALESWVLFPSPCGFAGLYVEFVDTIYN